MRDWGLVPVHHSISKGYRAIADLKPCKEQVAAAFDGLKEVVTQSPFPVIMNRQAIELRYRYASVGKCPFEGSKCTALRTHLFILPDGKVTVCEQLYWNPRFIVGDVTTESIREVWNSEKAMRLWQLDEEEMSSDSPCKECPVMEVCYSERNRCWADVIKAYGEEGWDYPDPRCERAPELKNRLNYDS
jgi:radical SAM protein with 4Fe4S-binding SPASM domain